MLLWQVIPIIDACDCFCLYLFFSRFRVSAIFIHLMENIAKCGTGANASRYVVCNFEQILYIFSSLSNLDYNHTINDILFCADILVQQQLTHYWRKENLQNTYRFNWRAFDNQSIKACWWGFICAWTTQVINKEEIDTALLLKITIDM